jgi:hypothetical protein
MLSNDGVTETSDMPAIKLMTPPEHAKKSPLLRSTIKRITAPTASPEVKKKVIYAICLLMLVIAAAPVCQSTAEWQRAWHDRAAFVSPAS